MIPYPHGFKQKEAIVYLTQSIIKCYINNLKKRPFATAAKGTWIIYATVEHSYSEHAPPAELTKSHIPVKGNNPFVSIV